MKTIKFTARTSAGVTFAVTLVLASACSKAPDPSVTSSVMLSPSSPTSGSADSASAPSASSTTSDVQGSGTVGTLTLPPDAGSSSSSAASAPLGVGIAPADPAASLPSAGGIGPASPSPDASAQPPSVSPGTRQ